MRNACRSPPPTSIYRIHNSHHLSTKAEASHAMHNAAHVKVKIVKVYVQVYYVLYLVSTRLVFGSQRTD